jgi:hypothetical protein
MGGLLFHVIDVAASHHVIQPAQGGGKRQAFTVVCFWPPLVALGGHRPKDQIFRFLRPESPFSSIDKQGEHRANVRFRHKADISTRSTNVRS